MATTDNKTPRASKTVLDSTGHPAVMTADVAAKAAESTASSAHKAADATFENTAAAARKMTDAAFSYPQFQVPEMFRSFADQGLNQTREAYSRMKNVAEEATDMLEESFETSRDSLREVQFKALDVAKNNADATFDLVRRMLSVTSVADAVQIQSTFARERFEALVDYSKDVQTTLGKVTTEAAKPARAMLDRALSQSKAA